MDMQIFIHSVFSTFSFIIGLLIFWKQKGSVSHKILGWIFWSSMMISTLSSFFIYKGSWSAIHILSILVAFWLIKAIYVSRFKPMNWMYIHASCMGAAYIAIIIAGAGVIVRKIILIGDNELGYITSAIVSIP